MIRYLHNNQIVSEPDLPADLTLLDYLRNDQRLTATKEGCASGDCGACTVALGRLDESGELEYQSVNACICPAAELHGHELVTAADLQQGDTLHPVQQAFVEMHASQCGFCTPGFIVSAFVLMESLVESLVEGEIPSNEVASQAVAGNLCRCTGYGTIVGAVKQAAQRYESPIDRNKVAQQLQLIEPLGQESALLLPESLEELARLQSQGSNCEIIAGGTDLMLEVTQRLKRKPLMLGLSRIRELQQITEERVSGKVRVGAGVSFNKLLDWARAALPELANLLLHIGSDQIRNRGTVGGNLGTASPIGDLPPLFLALRAEVRIWSSEGARDLPLEQFFTGYRTTVLQQNEIIHSVSFKLPDSTETLVVEKVSKRREDDISALLLAACFSLNQGRIAHIALGLGGVAATPTNASGLAAHLEGTEVSTWDYASMRELINQHLQPMDDLRASAEYRLHCTAALLLDALQEAEVTDEV